MSSSGDQLLFSLEAHLKQGVTIGSGIGNFEDVYNTSITYDKGATISTVTMSAWLILPNPPRRLQESIPPLRAPSPNQPRRRPRRHEIWSPSTPALCHVGEPRTKPVNTIHSTVRVPTQHPRPPVRPVPTPSETPPASSQQAKPMSWSRVPPKPACIPSRSPGSHERGVWRPGGMISLPRRAGRLIKTGEASSWAKARASLSSR